MNFYYASADNPVKNWKLDEAKVTHRLTTYFLLDGSVARSFSSPSLALAGRDPDFLAARDRACDKAIEMFRSHKDIVKSWVIDSGAHTYQQIRFKVPIDTLMAYADRYIDFCVRSRDLWDWCAELDVEEMYGQDFVEEVWDKMNAAGLPALRVWHTWRGIDAFKEYCQEKEYVGVAGPMPHVDDLAKMVRWAYYNGNKIHAFGVLRGELMKWPVFSSDAISWLSPEAWGQIIKFDRATGTLTRTSPKKDGLDLSILSTIADVRMHGYDAGTIDSVRELQAYEDYITRSWAERGVDFGEPNSPQWTAGE